MNIDQAYCYAQNNCSTNAFKVSPEIMLETNLSVVRAYLEGLYWSQDYGKVITLECSHYAFACGIQALWLKLGVNTDRVMSLRVNTDHSVRPINLFDECSMRDILYNNKICHVCWRGMRYGDNGERCTYCDNR